MKEREALPAPAGGCLWRPRRDATDLSGHTFLIRRKKMATGYGKESRKLTASGRVESAKVPAEPGEQKNRRADPAFHAREMQEAIAAAKAAFPAWRDTPAPNRGKFLFKATQIMQEQKEELARLLTREEGKSLKDSLGEVQRAINIMEFMAGEARRLNGETLPSELPKNFAYTIRQPLGIVGVITPWNFPVADSRLEDCAGAGLRETRWSSSPPISRRSRRCAW